MLKEEMLKHNFGSSQVCEINLEIQSKVHQVGINFFLTNIYWETTLYLEKVGI